MAVWYNLEQFHHLLLWHPGDQQPTVWCHHRSHQEPSDQSYEHSLSPDWGSEDSSSLQTESVLRFQWKGKKLKQAFKSLKVAKSKDENLIDGGNDIDGSRVSLSLS